MKNQYYFGVNPKAKKPRTHNSKKLNKLLNKKVQIEFKDGNTVIGFLEREFLTERYIVNGIIKLSFYKSFVKKITDISKVHVLKLQREYAHSKLNGIKPFEIRVNDRNFKVGDFVKYIIIEDEILNKVYEDRLYRIEYITHYKQMPGYIVFTDRFIKEE